MSEVERIVDQLTRAFEGNAWHGASIRELLADVTAAEAGAKPVASAHGIWELVLHIAVWEDVVKRRIEGDRFAISLSSEEDWPPVRARSEADWRAAIGGLVAGHDALMRAVSSLPDSRLDEIVPGHDYTIYTMLHGAVQHDLYHGGQIGLLKRAQRPA